MEIKGLKLEIKMNILLECVSPARMFFLGDPVVRGLKDGKGHIGKVDLVRVTRSGMLISCQENRKRALWLYKLLMYNVECYDFQSRAPNKGVISDVS